jgi:hypothetical protein
LIAPRNNESFSGAATGNPATALADANNEAVAKYSVTPKAGDHPQTA